MSDALSPHDEASGLLVIVMVPVSVWLWAITESHLWNWFVRALAPMAPFISVPIAAGVDLLVSCLLWSILSANSKTRTSSEIFSHGAVAPLFLLLVGWVIKAVWL
jgi:hypothetical protein